MTKLSVNINKFATLRNARGSNNPNVVKAARDAQRFGADGITIHPRPDERHITTRDVYDLAPEIHTEYNIEGYPDERYLKLIADVKPAQATLVPDAPHVLTSNAGWDTLKNGAFLTEILSEIKNLGIRTSLFVDPDTKMVEGAAQCGADRIELYTEAYARGFEKGNKAAIDPYREAANAATRNGLGINAGHDLDLNNLQYFHREIPGLLEVSIGHALICDAIYLGFENTIKMYLNQLR